MYFIIYLVTLLLSNDDIIKYNFNLDSKEKPITLFTIAREIEKQSSCEIYHDYRIKNYTTEIHINGNFSIDELLKIIISKFDNKLTINREFLDTDKLPTYFIELFRDDNDMCR